MYVTKRRNERCFFPVHFNTTEKQRLDLERYAEDNRMSLAEAGRDLIAAGLKAQGFEA